MVDSLINIKTTQSRLHEFLSEGSVTSTRRGIGPGGFSMSTFTDVTGDTIFLIQHRDNLQQYLIESYYFKRDRLVFSRIELQDGAHDLATIFLQEEYYSDDKVIRTVVVKDTLKKKGRWRTKFDRLAHGYYYLGVFKKRNP